MQPLMPCQRPRPARKTARWSLRRWLQPLQHWDDASRPTPTAALHLRIVPSQPWSEVGTLGRHFSPFAMTKAAVSPMRRRDKRGFAGLRIAPTKPDRYSPRDCRNGRTVMKEVMFFAVLALAAGITPADAKGCIKGALVGGVAGHYTCTTDFSAPPPVA